MARVLGTVLSEAQQYADGDFGDADAVLNALRGVTGLATLITLLVNQFWITDIQNHHGPQA